ncbi:hypothetical protein LOK49_LG04G01965 [Camellia lanceoleosa]|uniref:Uncharacterized protein n=1 Tax=Camellia lanceoleosa TaxID=1840588 RepID=A0ACC0HYF5_9ERIC|nr:hypothetical protein LOK49_LG04G01965 [Camellia lanceoleosa]
MIKPGLGLGAVWIHCEPIKTGASYNQRNSPMLRLPCGTLHRHVARKSKKLLVPHSSRIGQLVEFLRSDSPFVDWLWNLILFR